MIETWRLGVDIVVAGRHPIDRIVRKQSHPFLELPAVQQPGFHVEEIFDCASRRGHRLLRGHHGGRRSHHVPFPVLIHAAMLSFIRHAARHVPALHAFAVEAAREHQPFHCPTL